MEEQGFQLGDIKGMVRRRARLVVAITGLCFLIGVFVAAILPSRYQSYATLLIEPQSISKRLVDSGEGEANILNRIHLMTMQILSRGRLSRVIDDLDLYEDLAASMTREDVINHMRGQIWVEPVFSELETNPKARTAKDINTFLLYFRHDSPRTAAAVANRLANDFIDEHIRERVQVAGDTAEFIEGEQARLAQRLREIDAQMAQIKTANSGSLPEDRSTAEGQLQRGVMSLQDVQRRIAEAEGDEAFYRQQAVLVRSSEGRLGDVVGRAISPALRSQELEMRLGEMRARGLTDRHPDVVAMRAEMDELRAKIDGIGEEKGSPPVSVAEQEALALAERAAMRAKTARSEVEAIQTQIQEAQERLANLPRVAEQLDALAREYASLSVSFQDYSAKRLEANVAANMERRQKGEQFRVLEPAFPASAPYSPNRPLIVVLGLMLGVALGGGLALLLEAMDGSYHEPKRLQADLRIPVLASIPGILLQADRVAQRRRNLRQAVAASVVAGVMLFASAAGYVMVNRPGLLGGRAGEAPAATPAPAAPPADAGTAAGASPTAGGS